METDVAGFDQEHKRGGREQPKRGGDGMYVDHRGYRRLLLEVVVQIEAEADAHEDPENGEPDQRSAAIFTSWPDAVVWICTRFFPLVRQRNVKQWDGCDESTCIEYPNGQKSPDRASGSGG